MKLDTIALILVVIFALGYVLAFFAGVFGALPYSLILLIPGLVVFGLLGSVIRQRMTNKEDDYYENNVDK